MYNLYTLRSFKHKAYRGNLWLIGDNDMISFNLCVILSWDAGEDSFYGYRLSWLTTLHLWIDNLTYCVPVLLYHDVVSE